MVHVAGQELRPVTPLRQYASCAPGDTTLTSPTSTSLGVVLVPLDLLAPIVVQRIEVQVGASATTTAKYSLALYRGSIARIPDRTAPTTRRGNMVLQRVPTETFQTSVSNTSPAVTTSRWKIHLKREQILDPAQAVYFVGIQVSDSNAKVVGAIAGNPNTNTAFVASPTPSAMGSWPTQMQIVGEASVCPYVVLRSSEGSFFFEPTGTLHAPPVAATSTTVEYFLGLSPQFVYGTTFRHCGTVKLPAGTFATVIADLGTDDTSATATLEIRKKTDGSVITTLTRTGQPPTAGVTNTNVVIAAAGEYEAHLKASSALITAMCKGVQFQGLT